MFSVNADHDMAELLTPCIKDRKALVPGRIALIALTSRVRHQSYIFSTNNGALKQKAAFSLCCFDFEQRLQCNQLWQCLILHFYV